MTNKKGFTMIELLGVIVILGILSVMAIVSVTRLITKSKTEQKNSQAKTLMMAAESYMQANKNNLPKTIGEVKKVSASELKSTNYLKSNLKNADGANCMEKSFVRVYKYSATNYSYVPFIYCGNETVPSEDKIDSPTIEITFEDEKDYTSSDSDYQNVKAIKVKIKIAGNTINSIDYPIMGYSYAISVEENNIGLSSEVFNSGALSGNGKQEITLEKSLTEYIDITKQNKVKVKVVARNTAGGYSEKSKTSDDASGESDSTVHDKTPPKCVKITGEPVNNEWINITKENEIRKIAVTCSDGKGSGCIREKFNRTWPNEKQNEAEYAYIQIRDNAGNTNIEAEYIENPNPCAPSFKKDTCRVKVNVDLSYPEITISGVGAYKRKSNGARANNTNLINASSITKNSDTKYTLGAGKYIASNITDNSNWINSSYDQGILYEIPVTDNLHLASWKWETNAPRQTDTSADAYKNYRSGNVGENSSGDFSKTEEEMKSRNCGSRSETIKVYLKDEGKRKGRLTLTDKAGNKIYFYINANIDRTAPPVPAVKYYKYKLNNTNVSEKTYTPGAWSTLTSNSQIYGVHVQASAVDPKDRKVEGNITLGADLSGFKKFRYQGTNAKGTAIAEHDGGVFNFKGDNYEGKNKIQFRACDKAGNCSNFSAEKEIWVDTKAPTVEITGYSGSTTILDTIPVNNSTANRKYTIAYNKHKNLVGGWMNGSNYSGGVKYTIKISDEVSIKSYNWTTGKDSENSSNTSLSGTATKTYNFTIKVEGKRQEKLLVKDDAGNQLVIIVNNRLDRTAPSVPNITNPTNGNWTNKNIKLTLESKDKLASDMVGDDISGIGKYQWKYASTNWADYPNSAKETYNTTEYSAERNEEAYQRACDKAGNCSTASSTMIKIDKTAPKLSLGHTSSCSSGVGNKVTSSCSDGRSGVKSAPGTKYINWGSSGTLYFTCTDNAGNSTTKSYYLGADSCYCGHPAYWDGGYCKWDAYHTYIKGPCIGGWNYDTCFSPQTGGYICPTDVCSIIDIYGSGAGYCCCDWLNCKSRGPGHYEGAWVWSNYCTYHENTCTTGYA